MKALPDFFREAKGLSRKGNYLKALSLYKRVLQRREADDDDLAEAYAGAGHSLLSLGIFNEAEDYLRQALLFDPLDGGNHYLLGVTLSKLSRFHEAIFALRLAKDLEPKNAEVVRALGWAAFMTGKTRMGERLLRRAIQLGPQNIFSYCDLAVLYINSSQFEKAESILRKAERQSPKSPLVEEVLLALSSFKKVAREVDTAKKGVSQKKVKRQRFGGFLAQPPVRHHFLS